MPITRFEDETGANLSTIEKVLLTEHKDELSNTGTSYVNWSIKKQFTDDKKEIFNGKEITYNLFTFSFIQIPMGLTIDDDSVTTRTGFIIPYEVNGKVKYIIDKNSSALTIIRKMLLYTKNGAVKKSNIKFVPDEFVWMISRVYNGENILEGGSDNLGNVVLNSIRGFKGDTEDSLTTISAEGESVMNIISTLSFLIESKNLHQISIDFSYRKHTNVGITLNNRESIFVWEERYTGELLQSGFYERISKIILLLYTEVIPIITQNYQDDEDSNAWNQSKCIEFLQNVANELSEKVKSRIEDLKNSPEQLRL